MDTFQRQAKTSVTQICKDNLHFEQKEEFVKYETTVLSTIDSVTTDVPISTLDDTWLEEQICFEKEQLLAIEELAKKLQFDSTQRYKLQEMFIYNLQHSGRFWRYFDKLLWETVLNLELNKLVSGEKIANQFLSALIKTAMTVDNYKQFLNPLVRLHLEIYFTAEKGLLRETLFLLGLNNIWTWFEVFDFVENIANSNIIHSARVAETVKSCLSFKVDYTYVKDKLKNHDHTVFKDFLKKEKDRQLVDIMQIVQQGQAPLDPPTRVFIFQVCNGVLFDLAHDARPYSNIKTLQTSIKQRFSQGEICFNRFAMFLLALYM